MCRHGHVSMHSQVVTFYDATEECAAAGAIQPLGDSGHLFCTAAEVPTCNGHVTDM